MSSIKKRLLIAGAMILILIFAWDWIQKPFGSIHEVESYSSLKCNVHEADLKIYKYMVKKGIISEEHFKPKDCRIIDCNVSYLTYPKRVYK